jgi:hypothetical protein
MDVMGLLSMSGVFRWSKPTVKEANGWEGKMNRLLLPLSEGMNRHKSIGTLFCAGQSVVRIASWA